MTQKCGGWHDVFATIAVKYSCASMLEIEGKKIVLVSKVVKSD